MNSNPRGMESLSSPLPNTATTGLDRQGNGTSNDEATESETKTDRLHDVLADHYPARFRFTESNIADIATWMRELALSPLWYSNPKLFIILHKMEILDLFPQLLGADVTDLWLPLPKRFVKRWLNDAKTRKFLELQELVLLDENSECNLKGQHLSLESIDQLNLDRVKHLGAGGFGDVWHVRNRDNAQAYACKTLARPVRYDSHAEFMRNLKREIMGMRRVRHRHCVDLVASCTDMDSVTILSSPVANRGDLASLLGSEFNGRDVGILQHSIGCITSALAYLHSLKIRHDDLKPNNILIHGTNVLLTDFGFCLDSSDTGITTTAGPPTHSTRRYSAPEVFDHSQRSRLTDIWSLGCVLADIVSRLFGYSPDEMKSFWCSNGSRLDSYAENPDATKAWFTLLAGSTPPTRVHWSSQLWLASFVRYILLERNRLKRPTAEQVLNRLISLYHDQIAASKQAWIGSCCVPDAHNQSDSLSPKPSGSYSRFLAIPWPAIDIFGNDSFLQTFILDPNLRVLACSGQPNIGGDMTSVFQNDINGSELRDAMKELTFRSESVSESVSESSPELSLSSDSLSRIPFETYAKSVYLHPGSLMDMRTATLQIPWTPLITKAYAVYLIPATVQFHSSRETLCRTPFVALLFDPSSPVGERGTQSRSRAAPSASEIGDALQAQGKFVTPHRSRKMRLCCDQCRYSGTVCAGVRRCTYCTKSNDICRYDLCEHSCTEFGCFRRGLPCATVIEFYRHMKGEHSMNRVYDPRSGQTRLIDDILDEDARDEIRGSEKLG